MRCPTLHECNVEERARSRGCLSLSLYLPYLAHPAFLPLDFQGNKRQRFSAIAEGVANARYAFTPPTPDSLNLEP